MLKLSPILASLAISSAAFAQEPGPVQAAPAGKVSISSKGADVRSVLHDLFSQTGKSYVLEPNVRFVLYLNLKEVAFDEAFEIVCQLAELESEIQNGICFITKKRQAPKSTGPAPTQTTAPKTATPKGPLPKTVLNKRLTTRFSKVDIRALLSEIARQTGVTFEIAPQVPAYKVDAFLIDTSLKFALDTIGQAAGLEYVFTNNASIRIAPKPNASRVSIVEGASN